MAASHTVEHKEDDLIGMSANQKTPNPAHGSFFPGLQFEAGQPHQALFLVLSYLPLFELLSMSAVCVSLRDAVELDVLPWLHIIVDRPLSSRLSDDVLMRIAGKADGRLRTLALIDCFKITDYGLHRVVENNPLLSKLFIPGCTNLTPEGVVRAVKSLSQHSHGLKSLMISGICKVKNEHLEALQYHLRMNLSRTQQQPLLYHKRIDWLKFRNNEYQRIIDVDICSKCNEIRKVFDCSRQTCKIRREKLLANCQGCNFCIPRCEECGGCVEYEELEEAVCADILCSGCWLQLPKCNYCNRPYCKRHSDKVSSSAESAGFVCEVCHATNKVEVAI